MKINSREKHVQRQGAKLILILFVLIVLSGRTFAQSLSKEKVVAFFRQNLSRTPDIDHFSVSAQTLAHSTLPPAAIEALKKAGVDVDGASPAIFFEGAMGGRDFYSSGILTNGMGGINMREVARNIIGRSGEELFQVFKNELRVTHSGQENLLATVVKNQFYLISQGFHMGVGGLKKSPVRWEGNRFYADREGRGPIEGNLELKDGLPFLLTIQDAGSRRAIYKVNYEYPNPVDLLGGYPKTITRMQLSGSTGWMPVARFELLECKLSPKPIDVEQFALSNFIDSAVTFTNLYTNGISVATYSDGSVNKSRLPVMTSEVAHRFPKRIAVVALMAILLFGVLWTVRQSSRG